MSKESAILVFFKSMHQSQSMAEMALANCCLKDGEEHQADIIPPLDTKWPFLLRFPIAWFGVSIGLASQAYLWRTLARDATMHAPKQINMVVWSIAACSLVIISGTYMTKCVFYLEAVKREFGNAVRRNFFFAPWVACLFLALGEPPDIYLASPSVPSMSTLQISRMKMTVVPSPSEQALPVPMMGMMEQPNSPQPIMMNTQSAFPTPLPTTPTSPFPTTPTSPSPAPFLSTSPSPTPLPSTPEPLTSSARTTSSALTKMTMMMMVPILGLELKVYGQWLMGGEGRLSEVANPCTHLSVVGNFIGALLAAKEGWREAALFLWAVGIIHYLVLFVTLYQRLPSSESLPKDLHPVFFLFVAAPSTASVAWQTISGDFDYLSRLCFFVALFLYAALVVRLNFFRGFP